jgi:hypothetical protein
MGLDALGKYMTGSLSPAMWQDAAETRKMAWLDKRDQNDKLVEEAVRAKQKAHEIFLKNMEITANKAAAQELQANKISLLEKKEELTRLADDSNMRDKLTGRVISVKEFEKSTPEQQAQWVNADTYAIDLATRTSEAAAKAEYNTKKIQKIMGYKDEYNMLPAGKRQAMTEDQFVASRLYADKMKEGQLKVSEAEYSKQYEAAGEGFDSLPTIDPTRYELLVNQHGGNVFKARAAYQKFSADEFADNYESRGTTVGESAEGLLDTVSTIQQEMLNEALAKGEAGYDWLVQEIMRGDPNTTKPEAEAEANRLMNVERRKKEGYEDTRITPLSKTKPGTNLLYIPSGN